MYAKNYPCIVYCGNQTNVADFREQPPWIFFEQIYSSKKSNIENQSENQSESKSEGKEKKEFNSSLKSNFQLLFKSGFFDCLTSSNSILQLEQANCVCSFFILNKFVSIKIIFFIYYLSLVAS